MTADQAPAAVCSLDVLICTHNRRDLLARTLRSLNAAERPPAIDVKLVVAANACSDGTAALLAGYRKRAQGDGLLPLDWLAVATPGKSHALNEAIGHLRAEVVVFVDDDHRVDRQFLTAVCAAVARHPEAALFCGRILPDWDGSEPHWVHDTGPYRIYPLPIPRFDQGDEELRIEPGRVTPGGGNLFMRRGVFERVGAFATDLGPVGHNLGGAEDIEWVRRALDLGEVLYYAPAVMQYHYVDLARLRIGYLMRKAYERTLSMMRLDTSVTGSQRVPAYMVRKLVSYTLQMLLSASSDRRRHFLVRMAAAYGELHGFRRRRAEGRAGLPRRSRDADA